MKHISKGPAPLRRSEKIRKLKFCSFVWSQSVLQCLNSYTKNLPMFKIE